MKTFKEKWKQEYRKLRADGLRPLHAKACAISKTQYGNWSPKRRTLYETTTLPNGWKIVVKEEYDQDTPAPWKEGDCRGVVIEGRGRQELFENKYWPLGSSHYDVEASLELALRDGWDSVPYGVGTKREQARRAVKDDYEYLSRWCDNEWTYVVLIVTLLDENDKELQEAPRQGYESDADEQLCSEARGFAAHMIKTERRKCMEAMRQARIATRFKDALACGI